MARSSPKYSFCVCQQVEDPGWASAWGSPWRIRPHLGMSNYLYSHLLPMFFFHSSIIDIWIACHIHNPLKACCPLGFGMFLDTTEITTHHFPNIFTSSKRDLMSPGYSLPLPYLRPMNLLCCGYFLVQSHTWLSHAELKYQLSRASQSPCPALESLWFSRQGSPLIVGDALDLLPSPALVEMASFTCDTGVFPSLVCPITSPHALAMSTLYPLSTHSHLLRMWP